MTGIKRGIWASLLLMLLVSLIGCGKSQSNVKADASAFDNAPPEIKSAWDTAVSADQTNDYVTAVTSYKQILSQQANLSDTQIATVKQAYAALNQRLVAASMHGDSAARQALVTLGNMDHKQAMSH